MNAQPKYNSTMRVVRDSDTPPPPRITITNAEQTADIFRSIWDMPTIKRFESVYVMYLTRNGELIRTNLLNVGNRTTTQINKRLAVEYALETEAEWVILAHNHPSGDCTPSPADIEATKHLERLFRDMDIVLLDHVIISADNYCSLKDNKHIN